ncbi:replication protein A 32 kDa subunit B-like [Phalaenopsis equestris]|uniref:replication protein A 32 kDa subunit B-like n=1 Tax=Phalaenopsis equestris TaxID=78828 RepID=UPI0009E4A779|nr:replication protein A 32 kDa subunit B-like [Phalaenopsis equestris]
MSSAQYDGGASLFSGGGFMPSQATQTPEFGFSKSRASQGILPLTVKQISEAYDSNDDKSNFVVDGVDATNVKLLGIMVNKIERVTDVTFSLDDGSGRINVNRWVNETTDTNEMALVQNGMYVTIRGSLKGFQGKRQVVAYSVRPVIDFNEVTLHYLECIHVHMDNTRPKAITAIGTVTPHQNDMKGFQTPLTNRIPGMKFSENEIQKMVLAVFMEPASLMREEGLHTDEVARRLDLPPDQIKNAISYHIDIGNLYSTIDDCHHKSTTNG